MVSLVRDLAAGDDGHQRAFGVRQGLGDGVDLGRQQRAGAGDGGKLGDAVGGAFGAVGGAEGVVHEDVAQGGHLLGEFFAVFLLALVDAAVLQQDKLAGGHSHTVDPVGDHGDFTAQQFAQALGHRGQGVFGLEVALGRTAQMAGHHDGGAGVQRHLDAGHAGTDAGVFGDGAGGVLGNVEVGPDEDASSRRKPAGHDVGEPEDFHDGWSFGFQRAACRATTRTISRHLLE